MEKKSVYMICISVVVGFIILGMFVCYGLMNIQPKKSDDLGYDLGYQMITHGNSIIVFDEETGDYWQKSLPLNQAPIDWEKSSIPKK